MSDLFGDMLAAADQANREHQRRQQLAHLPDQEADAIAWTKDALRRHHGLMLDGLLGAALDIRNQFADVAEKLSGGAGIYADQDAAGYRLLNAVRFPAYSPAPEPLWGQPAEWTLRLEPFGVDVLIETDGFGDGFSRYNWGVAFTTNAVEVDQPFLSETGYRSFRGGWFGTPVSLTFPAYVLACIDQYIAAPSKSRRSSDFTGLGGKLVPIDQQHRESIMLHRQGVPHDDPAWAEWRQRWWPNRDKRSGPGRPAASS